MADELTPTGEIAALWGSAENPIYPLESRLNFALTALTRMAALVPGWED